ncbi:hypothetical protein BJF79_44800 [Actinomadura sp. CNU-125]|uniref:DUF4178 domain-containing protein n=1 Tax=Actinomadura sp. CNU-125 TaxID=1904961 RepID=UPI00095ABDC0|nr:DUF4178 domain-containing protein [Actinomadura sp. CNU-125]OLT24873.1 hypothetical protein BJF79_44800 [Actinomadura sp. CNU-125]
MGETAIVVLLALILVALVALIVVLVRRRSGAGAGTAEPEAVPRDPFAAEDEAGGDPRTIKAGDMIEYLGVRYFVRGSLRMREGGYTWAEHLLDADQIEGVKVWVSVEEDPDLEVVWWTETEMGDMSPSKKTITLDGVEYRREEHGTADYDSEGTTGLGVKGRVEYADYTAPKGRYLSFEQYGGGQWEAGLGERVPTGALTIYPGGG